MMKSSLILGLLACLSTVDAHSRPHAMTPNPEPYEIEQPDGSVILARMAGTEEDPHEECAPGEECEGYTIIGGGPAGNEYQFAVVDDETGDIRPNGQPVKRGKSVPQGVGKHVRRKEGAAAAMALGGSVAPPTFDGEGNPDASSSVEVKEYVPNRRELHVDDYSSFTPETEDFHRRTMTWKGVKRTLVIPMVFADHKQKWRPPQDGLNKLFNRLGGHAQYAPTGSIRDVFRHASYGRLDMISMVQDYVFLSKPESYYADGDRGFTYKMHEAMGEALDYLENVKKIDFGQFDTDNDGLIDSICFLHSGYAAEWGGNSKDGANFKNRIWSHKWGLYGLRHSGGQVGWKSSRHNVKVLNYHISPSSWGTGYQGDEIGRIGVIAHETGHFLGITDLYDTKGEAGSGLGSWGLMANSWGFDNTQRCPPAMSPWTKMQLNWLRPRTLTRSGNYLVRPSYRYGNVFKISKGFPSGEYLLIEYRMPMGFEKCMPGNGVAIWHIDDTADYSEQGYPGQPGWPGNGKHYRVALLQADGKYQLEKNQNRGDAGDLFKKGDSIGPGYNPSTSRYDYPNTDSYKNGNVQSTGITITIKNVGNTAVFSVAFGPSGSPQGAIAGPDAVNLEGDDAVIEEGNDDDSTEDNFDVEIDYEDEYGYGGDDDGNTTGGDGEDKDVTVDEEEINTDGYEDIVDEYGEEFKDETIQDLTGSFQASPAQTTAEELDEYTYADGEGDTTFDGQLVDGRTPYGQGENFVDTETFEDSASEEAEAEAEATTTEEALDEYGYEEEEGSDSLAYTGNVVDGRVKGENGMGFN